MGSELTIQPGIAEVDENINLRNRYLMNYLAEAAMADSARAGFTLENVFKTGESWVLSKIRLEFHQPVLYGSPLSVYTWHTGGEKCFGFRDYQVNSGGGIAVNATSVWVYTSIIRRKAISAPVVSDEVFGLENRSSTTFDIHAWKPETLLKQDFVTEITIRHSDYDPLNHVNNAVYIDYIETLWHLAGHSSDKKMTAVNIQYIREIGKGVERIEASLVAVGDSRFCYYLRHGDTVHAAGDIEWEPIF